MIERENTIVELANELATRVKAMGDDAAVSAARIDRIAAVSAERDKAWTERDEALREADRMKVSRNKWRDIAEERLKALRDGEPSPEPRGTVTESATFPIADDRLTLLSCVDCASENEPESTGVCSVCRCRPSEFEPKDDDG